VVCTSGRAIPMIVSRPPLLEDALGAQGSTLLRNGGRCLQQSWLPTPTRPGRFARSFGGMLTAAMQRVTNHVRTHPVDHWWEVSISATQAARNGPRAACQAL